MLRLSHSYVWQSTLVMYKYSISFFSAIITQAGIIEEMMDEAFEGVDDQEEMEEEVQNEVDKVLWELTAGMFIDNGFITLLD